jgi:hypothetical protein
MPPASALATLPNCFPATAGEMSAGGGQRTEFEIGFPGPGKKKQKFRFKNKLLSLDATVIALCASLFDWAQFRRSKGAVKLHLLLDHDGHLPALRW